MSRIPRKPVHGRRATRTQVDLMYAGMRAPPPPPEPAPVHCPTCTATLDPGTGHCERCRAWPLLGGPR